MSIRLVAFALLIGASLASAAPPKSNKSTQAPPADSGQSADAIDVDALARSKDVDAAAQSATGETSLETPPSDVVPTDTPPSDAPPADAAPAATPSVEETAHSPPAVPEAAVPAQSATDAAAAPAVDAGAQPAADAGAPAVSADAAADMQALSIASSCEARAKSLLDDAEKARWGEATVAFDAKMRSALPAPKFKEQWDSLAQFGKLTARGQSHLGKGEGYTIVVIPLIFEKANLLAQIACGSDGRIAGFHVTPAEKPQL
jgi:hypothetical protein